MSEETDCITEDDVDSGFMLFYSGFEHGDRSRALEIARYVTEALDAAPIEYRNLIVGALEAVELDYLIDLKPEVVAEREEEPFAYWRIFHPRKVGSPMASMEYIRKHEVLRSRVTVDL